MNIFEYEFNVYPFKLWVVFGEADFKDDFMYLDGQEVHSHVGNVVGVDANVIGDPVVVEQETNNVGVIVHFRTKRAATGDVIAHEAVHIAKAIFRYIGADIAPDEPFEYLVGYVYQCIDDAKRK